MVPVPGVLAPDDVEVPPVVVLTDLDLLVRRPRAPPVGDRLRHRDLDQDPRSAPGLGRPGADLGGPAPGGDQPADRGLGARRPREPSVGLYWLSSDPEPCRRQGRTRRRRPHSTPGSRLARGGRTRGPGRGRCHTWPSTRRTPPPGTPGR